jgi:ADP-heptose:LPS heptosyltransferase
VKTHASTPLPNIHKIAVLRANALGDFIFSLPALMALRATYREAEIVLLAKQWHAQFLTGRPSPVDRVIVIPAYAGVSAEPGTEENPAELEDFFQRMVQEHFDLAIQLHGGGGYSNPFIRRLQASVTAGLKAPEAEALDYWIPYLYFQPEITRYLEVVALVGASPLTLEPAIAVTQQDRQEISRYLPPADQTLVVLHPGASDVRRRWPADKFAAVGDALAAQGAHVIVTGNEQEQDVTAAVVQAMRATAQDLAGRLSLGGLAGLLAHAKVVVTNDTGPMHLAHAVGSKTVGIYWAYNVMTAGQLTRSRHRPVITWRMHCPVCGADNAWQPCAHRVSFVSDIRVEDVIEPALELLASQAR